MFRKKNKSLIYAVIFFNNFVSKISLTINLYALLIF